MPPWLFLDPRVNASHLTHPRWNLLPPTPPLAYATMPTGLARFHRTFAPYQLLRFVVINVKMPRLIIKSHATPPGESPQDTRY